MPESTNGGNGHIVLTDGEPAPRMLHAGDEGELRTLTTSILLDRLRFARQAGITFDGQRDEYEIFGYDRLISTKQFRDEYARGGIAGRIVDVYPNATWRGSMEIVEDDDPDTDTSFEKAWKELDTRLQIQAKLLRADKLSGLSSYAVLLIGAPGDPASELPKASSPSKLLYLTPFFGGGGPSGSGASSASMAVDADATIFEFEVDPKSPRFGLPKSYQIRRLDIASPLFQRPVHWSRVIHIAENVMEDDVYGQPRLERVWNLLCDLRKVTGGGAEAFFLRANQGMHLNMDKDMSVDDAKLAVDALKEQAEAYKHQLTRWLRTRGVDIKTLGSDVANFANPADAILTQIAGALGIPKRILTGSEMGELASSQDRENWRDQVNGRQTGYAGPYIVRPLVDRLVAYGYLPTPAKGPQAYEVHWPQIQVLTEDEKAMGAQRWAAVNQTYGSVVFVEEEIRDKWYGMAPLTDEQREEIAERADEKVRRQQELFEARSKGKVNEGLRPEALVEDVEKEIKLETKLKGPRSRAAEAADDDRSAPPELLSAQARKFSSTQVQLPPTLARRLKAFAASIPDDELAEDGREDDAHVTVKYGIHTNDASEVRSALAELSGRSARLDLTLGKTNFFIADTHDVVYVEVDSPDLRRLNKQIASSLDVTDTHPRYVPHATVAYVKKGLGKKYAGDDRFDGLMASISAIRFSPAEGEDVDVELGLRAAGGPGSGNWGHGGTPGQGGSPPKGGGGPDPKTTNFYQGVFYFPKDDAEEWAAKVSGTVEKTSRGFRVRKSDGSLLGPESDERRLEEVDTEEEALVRVLAAAIESGATDVIEEMCGMRAAYNPDQPRDERGRWVYHGTSAANVATIREKGLTPNEYGNPLNFHHIEESSRYYAGPEGAMLRVRLSDLPANTTHDRLTSRSWTLSAVPSDKIEIETPEGWVPLRGGRK